MSQNMTNLEGIVRVQTQKCPPAGDRLMIDCVLSWRLSNSGECPSMKHRDPFLGFYFLLSPAFYLSLPLSLSFSWVGCEAQD